MSCINKGLVLYDCLGTEAVGSVGVAVMDFGVRGLQGLLEVLAVALQVKSSDARSSSSSSVQQVLGVCLRSSLTAAFMRLADAAAASSETDSSAHVHTSLPQITHPHFLSLLLHEKSMCTRESTVASCCHMQLPYSCLLAGISLML